MRFQFSSFVTCARTAPEAILCGVFAESSDVYMMGVVIWEILTKGQVNAATICHVLFASSQMTMPIIGCSFRLRGCSQKVPFTI